MLAFRVDSADQPPALADISMPKVGRAQVLVRIEACGLNFADQLMVSGKYQETPEAPFTLGMELSGTVVETGPDTTDVSVGDRVAIFAGSGGLAEYGVFDASRCVRLPDAMPMAEAAGFQVAYGTSHLALARRAHLRAGETLVVLGAAGGVGLTAVEIGAAIGARVIAVARGADKLKAAQDAGAAHLIDSDTADLRAELKALGGFDVLYDPVGGDQFRAAMRAAKPLARLIVIGFASGDVPQIPANHLLVKNLDVIGFYWGGYLKFAPEIHRDSMAELFEMYANGHLKPHISHTFPLDRAGEALDLLASRKATGKVVVTMPAPDADVR